MTDHELLRYQRYREENWLEWLHRVGGGKLLRAESIQVKRPEQYDLIMEMFGDWENVRRKFAKRYGQEQPKVTTMGLKNEPPEAKEQKLAPIQQKPLRTPDELLTLAIQECAKEEKMLSNAKWMTLATLDFEEVVMVLGGGSWDAAKRKIEYAWKQHEMAQDQIQKEPVSAAGAVEPKLVVPEEEAQNVKEDGKMTELANNEGTPKKLRKTRVSMTAVEMREFVLEAMKVLGEKPSKAEYDAYAREHGGVSAAVIVHHGLGVSKWPQIAAEERARLLEETPVDVVQQKNGAMDIMQVLIHGIDATVTIGGLEMQVRLDFGAKK